MKTDSQGTSTINGVTVGDLVKIQEKDTPSTLTTTTITSDGSFSWVYELSKEYQVRIYRTGVDSPLFEISASATIGNPAFLPISGATYTQPTGKTISDYAKFEDGNIYATDNYVESNAQYVGTFQDEINFWFEANNLAPFGITANHILSRVDNGIITLTRLFTAQIITDINTTYEYLENNSGTKLKVSSTSQGDPIELLPSTLVSNVVNGGYVDTNIAIQFINTDGTVYAHAVAVEPLLNAGGTGSLEIIVSPPLRLYTNKDYRNKEVKVAVTHIGKSSHPTYQWSNQYEFYNNNGEIERVDKTIAFLQRGIITVDVDGGYTEADRTNATEIKAGTTSLVGRKVITTNKVVDITSGKLGENEGYAKDLFGTIHGDIYFSFAGSTIKREIMELYKDKSIPTNPRIVFKVKALAGEVSTDFPEEVILLKINKTLTRHTFTVGDNIEYQLSDTEQIFTDGERFKFAIGQEDTRLIGNLSDIDVDTDKLETAIGEVKADTTDIKEDTESIKNEFVDKVVAFLIVGQILQ